MIKNFSSLLAVSALMVLPACDPCSKKCCPKEQPAATAAAENQSPATTHSCTSDSCTKDHAHAPTEPVTAEQPATEQVTETEVSKI